MLLQQTPEQLSTSFRETDLFFSPSGMVELHIDGHALWKEGRVSSTRNTCLLCQKSKPFPRIPCKILLCPIGPKQVTSPCKFKKDLGNWVFCFLSQRKNKGEKGLGKGGLDSQLTLSAMIILNVRAPNQHFIFHKAQGRENKRQIPLDEGGPAVSQGPTCSGEGCIFSQLYSCLRKRPPFGFTMLSSQESVFP